MKHERRGFTAEYKQQVAWMAVDDGVRVADVCRDQYLGETAVRRWIYQLKAERGDGHEPGTASSDTRIPRPSRPGVDRRPEHSCRRE